MRKLFFSMSEVLWLLLLLAYISEVVAAIFVLVHFIRKYW